MPVLSNAAIMESLQRCAGCCRKLQEIQAALVAGEEVDADEIQSTIELAKSELSFEETPNPRANSTTG